MINMFLYQILVFTIHGKKQKSYTKILKLKYPTWNGEFELPECSYSVSDIQEYFEYTIEKYEAITDNPSIKT